jgi:hypothetical protein
MHQNVIHNPTKVVVSVSPLVGRKATPRQRDAEAW